MQVYIIPCLALMENLKNFFNTGRGEFFTETGEGPESSRWCQPDLGINGFTGKIYAGAFAEVYSFRTKKEIGAQVHWDFRNSKAVMAHVLALSDSGNNSREAQWQPIGKSLLKWGKSSRLPLYKTNKARIMSFNASVQSVKQEEELVLENLTWVAHPSILLNGKKSTILYALYDTAKPWYQSSDVAQIVQEDQDKPWAVKCITDDNTSEFNPMICKVDGDTQLAAWSTAQGDISAVKTPEDIAPYLEITACFYDAKSKSWGTPFSLTDNDVTDRKPMPVCFGTQGSSHTGVLWIQNKGKAMVGTSASGDSLMYSGWNGTGWDAPVNLWSSDKGILDYSFISDAKGEAHIVMTVDEDGDPATTTDLELYSVDTKSGVFQQGKRLTDNQVADELPVLINPGSDPLLVWSSDSTLMYSSLSSWNPEKVYKEQTLNGDAPSLDGVSFPGGAAIAYSAQGPDGVNIFAAFYDSALGVWSQPRQLTHDKDAESSMSLAFDGTKIVIAYLKTQTLHQDVKMEMNGQMKVIKNVPQPGRTDIYVLRHALGYDLSVVSGSLVVSPANPAPGATADITANIMNNGDLPAQNVLVYFYDGNPDAGGVLIDQATIDSIIAGGSHKVDVSWSIPSDLNSHKLFVVVDPKLSFDDRDRTNNMISAWSVLPDLVVQTSQAQRISGRQVAITSKIVNAGVIPSGRITVHWYLKNEKGMEAGSRELDSITAGAYRECTLIWDDSNYKSENGSVKIFTVVDAENTLQESNESNNSYFTTIDGLLIVDSDGDGIDDVKDKCPGTPQGVVVDSDGCIIKGDVSGNGKVNLEDSTLGLKVITLHSGLSKPSVHAGADVNGDGKIGLNDDIYIIQQTLKKSGK